MGDLDQNSLLLGVLFGIFIGISIGYLVSQKQTSTTISLSELRKWGVK